MPRWIVCTASCFLLSAGAAASQQQPVDREIADAVSPLPESMRAGATVLGYAGGNDLRTLRQGTNPLICLADDPARDGFHAACYHQDLEPFMARGRALRSEGVSSLSDVNAVRRREIDAGTLTMPDRPAALFSLTGESAETARRLHVIYIPYATEETTGISEQPSRDRPWLMFPGAPWAHVMISLP